ncbi:hypothetical protein MTO96_049459 [Rhipicephalus appendiculatus]
MREEGPASRQEPRATLPAANGEAAGSSSASFDEAGGARTLRNTQLASAEHWCAGVPERGAVPKGAVDEGELPRDRDAQARSTESSKQRRQACHEDDKFSSGQRKPPCAGVLVAASVGDRRASAWKFVQGDDEIRPGISPFILTVFVKIDFLRVFVVPIVPKQNIVIQVPTAWHMVLAKKMT